MELESDNAAVVDAIKNRNQKLSALWHFYEDIESFEGKFGSFKVNKISRESNQAAHVLTKLAKSSMFNSLWLGHVPTEVASFVSADLVDCVISVE